MSAVEQQTTKYDLYTLEHITVRFVNSKPLDNLALHGIKEFAKIENGVPEQPTSAFAGVRHLA
jgi:hypothetical protein